MADDMPDEKNDEIAKKTVLGKATAGEGLTPTPLTEWMSVDWESMLDSVAGHRYGPSRRLN